MEGDVVVVYVSTDGHASVRLAEEFEDGRFIIMAETGDAGFQPAVYKSAGS